MKKYSSLEYLKLTKLHRFFYKVGCFFASIPGFLQNLIITIGVFFKKIGLAIYNEFADIGRTFIKGDYKTRISYFIMGFGSFTRKQYGRGLLFLLAEVAFIIYMIFPIGASGSYWLSMLPSLGKVGPGWVEDEFGGWIMQYNDNSFQILLYGILTIFFIVAIIYTWRINVKQNRIAQEIIASGKPIVSTKDDIRSLVDNEFHKTLLALPITGILLFTVLPIIFMILVAFTNYSGAYNGYTNKLFSWQGFENFNILFTWTNSGGSSFAATFGQVLGWTLMWAVFATFSNYFLGMLVAIIINKKGIKLKKWWRTVLVLTIAIPQFISLLYISKLFAYNGIVNGIIQNLGGSPIHFMDDNAEPWLARLCVILINIWIGIPYLMLIATGILMNIPEDLYESSRVDGANGWQQYMKITLPYMLFVTGPYLLTSFTGNMNNFNVIFLLTGGCPTITNGPANAASVGSTDLLVTWLFKISTTSGSKYYLASVMGILIFVITAVISVIVYNVIPSNKNEEDFQ